MCGLFIQNSDFWTGITNLYESQTSPVVLCLKSCVIFTKTTSLYGFQPSSFFFFFIQNSDFGTRLTSLYGSQTSSVVMSTHNSVLSPRIKRLYGFQPSRVVLCMQISDFSTWITSLCWSQPSSVVFACKTATFVRAYKSLWVPDLNCRFVHTKQRD